MISPTDIENALNMLDSIGPSRRYSEICKLSKVQKQKYKQLLEHFEFLNRLSPQSPNAPKNLHNLKGDALENLVKYLFQISGGIFKVICNLHTCTNEIDDLISLTEKGKVLLSHNLINTRLTVFLGECKNYNTSVGVTYVGKFCSLLLTNNIKLGILFSYHGISGNNWNAGAGLVKKFYLHKENLDERFCIIDFSINDFNSILSGKNLLDIIDGKIMSLQLDTDYSKHIQKHPAE